ncbi:hypothetical protein FQA39_LY17479 [Lamprigera yunnana]|nr:hypothetical protein FQA39_LY17479 [Lamprigera yunnana]
MFDTQQLTGAVEYSEIQFEDSVIQGEDSFTQLRESSIYAQQTSPTSPPLLTEISIITSDRTCPTSSASKRPLQKQKKNSAAMANACVAQYFQAKKAKLLSNAETETGSQRIDRQQGIKMFLISLIPELEELSDSQIKLFKRQVFRLIDDITISSNQPQTSSAFTIITPPTLSESSASDTSQTSNLTSHESEIQRKDCFYTILQNVKNSDM